MQAVQKLRNMSSKCIFRLPSVYRQRFNNTSPQETPELPQQYRLNCVVVEPHDLVQILPMEAALWPSLADLNIGLRLLFGMDGLDATIMSDCPNHCGFSIKNFRTSVDRCDLVYFHVPRVKRCPLCYRGHSTRWI
jgi:hypothetical protein